MALVARFGAVFFAAGFLGAAFLGATFFLARVLRGLALWIKAGLMFLYLLLSGQKCAFG